MSTKKGPRDVETIADVSVLSDPEVVEQKKQAAEVFVEEQKQVARDKVFQDEVKRLRRKQSPADRYVRIVIDSAPYVPFFMIDGVQFLLSRCSGLVRTRTRLTAVLASRPTAESRARISGRCTKGPRPVVARGVRSTLHRRIRVLKGPEVKDAAPDTIATAITIQGQAGGKQMVVQTYLERDASIGAYHGFVDKMYRVMERQEWKELLEMHQRELFQDEKNMANYVTDFNSIGVNYAADWAARGKKGEPVLGAKEKAQKHNSENNIKNAKGSIDKHKKAIAELEQKLKDEPGG
jgi:hypothetical protein